MYRAIILLSTIFWAVQLQANPLSMQGEASLQPSEAALQGSLKLKLEGGKRIYNVRVFAINQHRATELHRQDLMQSRESLELDLDLPHQHPYPGRYHLLLAISFTDAGNQAHSMNMAISYAFQELGGLPTLPLILIDKGTLNWDTSSAHGEFLGLDVTTAPHWQLIAPVRMGDNTLALKELSAAVTGESYPQYAVLNWAGEDGNHYSRVIPWEIRPGESASNVNGLAFFDEPGFPTASAWLLLLALSGAAALYFKSTNNTRQLQATFDYSVIAAITLWLANFLHPELWFLNTWPSGGDLASHVLYADRFTEWFSQGKVTGWMPEVFAGFPAFRFYFPLPFAVIALLSLLLPVQVAIKLALIAPPLLLPLCVYWMCGRFQWTSGARLFAALFSVAFLIHDGATVWGGNLRAIFAGEFAYSWGLLLLLVFWGSLAWALRLGGIRWLAPAILLALVALSHGYPLLLAGFSALFAPLFTAHPGKSLIHILRIHATAFLLIGFWLIPLFEYIPFTIPNDTSVWVKHFSTFVPHSMLPILFTLPFVVAVLRRPSAQSGAIWFLILSAILATAGYFGAYALGLADIRLFPFTQLTLAIACGGALGIFLQRRGHEVTNWSVAIVGLLLAHYWLAGMTAIEDRAEWSMEGYERKVMWPHYKALADHLAGPISAPRVLFEHAPVNTDVGSTRAMEALPLFGSRPVLEGLYMEAAFSGPFIYQLQAEVSSQPSSPLSRFPTVKGTATDIAERLDQFYADTVVARSLESVAELKAHQGFSQQAEIGPFVVFGTVRTPELIEIATPETLPATSDWLEAAYEKFILYGSRKPEVRSKPVTPNVDSKPAIEILTFNDEYLKFRTDHPGQPHWIKITYHPAWYSTTGEAIELTAPSFMQITPGQREVELVFGETNGQILGRYFSLAGLLMVLLPLFPAERARYQHRPKSIAFSVTLMAVITSIALFYHPSRNYQIGHDYFRVGDFNAAAEEFEKSIPFRHVKAQRAEVLFWAARSSELAGDRDTAIEHYQRLLSEIPASYWAPESLYRMAHIYRYKGDQENSILYGTRLAVEFPRNDWSRMWASE